MEADLGNLSKRFYRLAERAGTSPLYRHLAMQIAEDPPVLRIVLEARSVPATLLFLAAVQYLLMEGIAHSLKSFYPNFTQDAAPVGEAYPHFRAFCLENQEQIIHLLRTRRTQTNEIRRCSYLALGLSIVARRAQRFSLIDVGSSAGLHLLWRSFAYRYETEYLGKSDSPVQLQCELLGPFRPPIPPDWPNPIEQIGIDLQPLNPRDPADRNWLRALIWPEHHERATLLHHALQIAHQTPPNVVPGDVFEVLPAIVQNLPPGDAVCVCHNHVINQFSEMERSRLDELLARLSHGREVFRLAAEWIGTTHTEFTLSRYKNAGKSQKLLAVVDDHGKWIRWADNL